MVARAHRRRQEATMLAIAFNDPKKIDDALPIPKPDAPSRKRWW
jgi:hypothetical protein